VPELKEKLAHLKGLDLKNAICSMWIVHRSLKTDKTAAYKVFKVETEEKLSKKLKNKLISTINKSNNIEPYQFITGDQDDALLGLPAEDTDFLTIKDMINAHNGDKVVTSAEQIEKSWGYITRLQVDKEFIFSYRKSVRAFNTKNVAGYFSFHGNVLIDLNYDKVFTMDFHTDFMCHDDTLFILDKKSFESALNFRQGMEAHRDETLSDFEELGIFKDIEPLRTGIGSNLNMLRKIAMVHNSGYYKEPEYMAKLQNLNLVKGWGLTIEDGKIVVTEDNIKLVLTLLNNDRLLSEITEETFDVAAKAAVGAGEAVPV